MKLRDGARKSEGNSKTVGAPPQPERTVVKQKILKLTPIREADGDEASVQISPSLSLKSMAVLLSPNG